MSFFFFFSSLAVWYQTLWTVSDPRQGSTPFVVSDLCINLYKGTELLHCEQMHPSVNHKGWFDVCLPQQLFFRKNEERSTWMEDESIFPLFRASCPNIFRNLFPCVFCSFVTHNVWDASCISTISIVSVFSHFMSSRVCPQVGAVCCQSWTTAVPFVTPGN